MRVAAVDRRGLVHDGFGVLLRGLAVGAQKPDDDGPVSRWRSSRPCGGTDAPTAVFGAHDTCAFLAAGHDAEEAVEKGMANNASMTRADEMPYVDAAILAHCPRYMRLTGTLT